MTVIEALKKVKDEKVMAYRKEWTEDPVLKFSGIVWFDKYGYCYWYKNAPVPERYSDDDPRIGVDVGTLPLTSVMAEDWEVEEVWRVVKP